MVLQTKMRDAQNRLGFVRTLARSLAEKMKNTGVANRLLAVEKSLHGSVLVRELTFCREDMPEKQNAAG